METRAEQTPDSLAFAVAGEEVSYGELFAGVMEAAGGLARCGLTSGDRCALLLPTGIDIIRFVFATQLLGAAPVALNTSLPAGTLLRRIVALRAKFAVCEEGLRQKLQTTAERDGGAVRLECPAAIRQASPGPLRPETLPSARDVAYLQVTSGTTGAPKAAVLLHRNLTACLEATAQRFEHKPEDVFVSWVPLYHDLGLVRFLFMPVFLGRPCHLIPPAISNFGLWLKTIGRVRGTITGGPDFAYRIAARIVDPADVDLHTLRYAINGGEPVRKSTIELFEKRFAVRGVVRPGYGLAEATLGVASTAPEEPLRVDSAGNLSCGRALRGVAVRIVDRSGRMAAPGQTGEIQVGGAQVFDGYLDDAEASRRALPDGWLATGDVGYLDDDDHLYVLGRQREMIKRAGAAIAPREIEEAVDRVDGVRFSAAVGQVSDALGGSEELVVVAEIRPDDVKAAGRLTSLADAISTQVVRTIGHVPDDVYLVMPHTIPRTDNGKIKHAEMHRLLADGTMTDNRAVLFATRERLAPETGTP